MKGDEIIAVGRAWLNTKWQHGQSCKGVGADCIGFVGGVALELGIPEAKAWAHDPRWKGYGRTPNPDLLIAMCDEYLDRIEIAEADVGDVLVMKHEPEDQPRHFAFVSKLNPMYMLHAWARSRKVVENRVDHVWRSRILRVYRFR